MMTGISDPNLARPARILIVDDEPLNVDYLEQELESVGFVTETAANGLEALERVASAAPDLVLLDVMMPDMDGITALRILKDDPETMLIPVVLMTALNAVEDRVRGIEAGADDFLSKPVDDRELLARINTALNVKRAFDATVGELRTTTEHLERDGVQEREVAVLAVDWRLSEGDLPDEAVAFVGRRRREQAEERIRALRGIPTESDADVLLAVFDGADPRARSTAAVEAAFAVLAEDSAADPDDARKVITSAAVGVGSARVGSTRVGHGREARWVFGVEGEPADLAAALARSAAGVGVLATAGAAAALRDRFRLQPADGGAYRVLEPGPGDGRSAPVRLIRTILMTDIVESTKLAERVGDRAWAELLAAHEQTTRRELALFGGLEIDTTGDGFLLAFESPARAIRYALALRERLADLGLTIRAGIHTGEVEEVDGKPRGIALHLTDRIAAKARPGEVLVSATTRELAAGSGLVYVNRGVHALKGVSEPRRLHAVAAERAGTAPGPAVLPRRPDAGKPYPAGLTEREVDVLRLVAVGLSDAEVAKQLFLSVRTVNAHLRSIYRKLGVRSRAAAGRFAETNDLL
jgi:DNA-binding NarL/FixJ family response regulator